MNVLNRAGVQNIYNHKVRINNWSEDQELHELRIKEYLHRKSHGTLLVHQVQKHLASSLQQVGLTYSRDGYVHIGDHVMLYSVATEGVLSTDISDKPHPHHIAVTTSTLTQAHVARNTFIIEAYGNQGKEGDILKLGQPFRLRINPKLSNEAFYLHSAPVSASSSSKVSRQQEVTMCSANAGYDTVWKVQWRDIAQRFEMEGQGVPANAEVIIVHAQTQHALASDKLNYYNDFGLEYEVSSHTHMSIAKTQGLYAELHGKTTTDIPVRKEAAPNHWAFLTAAVPEMENMLNEQEVKVDVTQLLSSLRENIMSRGPMGVHAVYKAFRVLDKDKQDVLSEDAFRQALKSVDINLSDDEFIALCGVFDTQHDRTVNYHQFLTKIRGPVSARRTRLISKLFDTIDTSSNGVITIDQLIRVFNPNTHLDVRQKKVSAATLIQQLTDAFTGLNRDRTITRDEFHDYYASIGAFVEHDDYFALQICNSYPVKE